MHIELHKLESSASLCVHELGSSNARSVMLCFYRGRNNGNNTEETEFVSTPRNARGPEGVQAKIKNPEFHYTLGETLANVPSTPYLGVYPKAQSHIPSRMSSASKHEKFWSVRCDSLGVHQKLLMIWRERRKNVIYLSCASTSAPIFCMLKNVSMFPRVNVDARRTSDQRKSNARHK